MIKNVQIIVRLEGGGIKKALFDGAGNVVSGDISVLEDEKWAPKGVGRPVPPPPPVSPSINAPFDMPKPKAVSSADTIDLIPEDLDGLGADDIPDDL